MLAFEILVNGKKLCIAGTEVNAVLDVCLSWTKRRPDTINFHVGGIAGDGSGKHVEWQTPCVDIGDEVSVRLINTDSCDEPDRKFRFRREHQENDGSSGTCVG